MYILLFIFILVIGNLCFAGLAAYYRKSMEFSLGKQDFVIMGIGMSVLGIIFMKNTISVDSIVGIGSWDIARVLSYIMLLLLLMVGWIDYRVQLIPNMLNVMIFLIGLISQVCLPDSLHIWERMLGMFLVSVPLFLLNMFYPEGIGGGDIKFLMAIGFFLGWEDVLEGLLAGAFLAAAVCLLLLVLKKKQRKDKLAFGPYLCIGMMLVILT